MSEDLTKTIPQSADEKLTLILTTVLSMTVRVDSIDSRLGRVDEKLGQVEQTVDKAVADVAQLQEGQRRLEGCVEEGFRRLDEGQEVLRSEIEALKSSVKYRFMILSGEVQASYRSMERRVSLLESNANPPNSQT
jgi:hypothetical protein